VEAVVVAEMMGAVVALAKISHLKLSLLLCSQLAKEVEEAVAKAKMHFQLLWATPPLLDHWPLAAAAH
jgi:hypothetical protein